ncbi:MAG: glycoside hydrolase family 28 protein [Clostridia bacterium]|nr:glycoside hydrolase family 28 protein [Clostridia bacterium]
MEIHSAFAANGLTLWWDQPAGSPENAEYAVLLDGREIGHTNRTHYALEAPGPDRAHDIRVLMNGKEIGCTRARPGFQRRRLNVKDFGALGDGKTMDTKALQAAVDRCGPDEEVYLPAGVYLTGALRLHSDMALCLAQGAVLQGTQDPKDYLPKIRSRFEGTEMECYQSLLNLGEMDHAAGPNCRNVLIYGKGVISGGGQELALGIIDAEKKRLEAYLASLGDKIREYENDHTIPGRARGRLINLSNCENIRITGLTLQNGASWNVHMLYSRNIVTDHCVFRSEKVWNGDGWDPDSSECCTLFASEFHTGDDSVAIKSGKNPEGNRIHRPTRHIRVFDCVSEYGLGIAIGSEMSGGVEDVKIWDCNLAHSLYGVQIKATKKRGGYVKDISVRDSVLSRFLACAVLYNDDGEGSDVPPVFSDFCCERVRFTGWARDYWEKEDHPVPGIDVSGFDVPGYEARDMRFSDCVLEEHATVSLRRCRQIALDVRKAE